MPIMVRIPTPLRRLTGNIDKVEVDADTLQGVVDALDQAHEGIKARICGEDGEIRHFVNVYVNGEDVRYLDGLNTPTKTGDEISIVPAVAGGH
ncbi:MAG: ubiquitin-like small modifier protein 1 [Dehalococcoidia bacterium]